MRLTPSLVRVSTLVAAGRVLVGDTTLKVVSLSDGLPPEGTAAAPIGHVPAVVEARALALQDGGTRVLAVAAAPTSGHASPQNGSHAIVLDAATDVPTVVAQVTLPPGSHLTATVAAASATHFFVCVPGVATTASTLMVIDATTPTAAAVAEDLGRLCFADGSRPATAHGDVAVRDRRVYALGVAGAVHVADLDLPTDALVGHGPFVDGALAALHVSALDRTVLVDLAAPAAPQIRLYDATAELGAEAYPIAVRGALVYFVTPTGLRRARVSGLDDVDVDDWRVDDPRVVGLQPRQLQVDDDVLVVTTPSVIAVARTDVGGPRPLTPFAGRGELVRILDDGADVPLFVSSTVVAAVDDASAADPAVPSAFFDVALGPMLWRSASGRGIFSPAERALRGSERGALGSGPGRQDRRPAPFDVQRVEVADLFDGDVIRSQGVVTGFAAVGAAPVVHAAVAEGCSGAALVSPEEGSSPRVVTFTTCGADADIAVVGHATLEDIDAEATLELHGDRASVVDSARAALVDLSVPDAPAVLLETDVPELSEAAWVSAGADGDAWLLIGTPSRGAPRALLLDVAAGAVTASWELPGDDATNNTRRRVLGVHWPRAYVTDHDPQEVPERGHLVDIYDLTSTPPQIEASIPIASEAVDLALRGELLVVARGDGITLVTPPCGP
jgi:hypothetical protein